AAGDLLGLVHVGEAAPADAVHHDDGAGAQVGVAVPVQPLEGHRHRAGGVGTGRGDQHQAVGGGQGAGDAGGGRVEDRDLVEAGEQVGEGGVVAVVEGLHVGVVEGGDDLQAGGGGRGVAAHVRVAVDAVGVGQQGGQRLRGLRADPAGHAVDARVDVHGDDPLVPVGGQGVRSEERRVGKESRYRKTKYQGKN